MPGVANDRLMENRASLVGRQLPDASGVSTGPRSAFIEERNDTPDDLQSLERLGKSPKETLDFMCDSGDGGVCRDLPLSGRH
jgi:hypothetical protein